MISVWEPFLFDGVFAASALSIAHALASHAALVSLFVDYFCNFHRRCWSVSAYSDGLFPISELETIVKSSGRDWERRIFYAISALMASVTST
jgi:hypothetical protein